MQLTAYTKKNTETHACVLVEITYDTILDDPDIYFVTIDKITSQISVNKEGHTKLTRYQLPAVPDAAELEEIAVLCCIHYQG